MARNPSRQVAVANAIQARRPAHTGGTQAPRALSRGPRMGIGQARPAQPKLHAGLGSAQPLGQGGGPGNPGQAPAPKGPSPTPWSSKEQQTNAAAQRKYLLETGNFDLAESAAKQDYGLDPGFNDYKANPYSRAALLEQSYQNANRGTMNSAGLQLYSGSTSNALGTNRSVNDANRNALANSYREALGEITQGRLKAKEAKDEAEQQSEWDAIGEAEAHEPDAEAAPFGRGKGKGGRKGKGRGKGKGKNK